ncbi:MAG: FKBP-type peptidyl-prolyl cis-trans isomerase [Oligoflexales bacterium]|nr:FKBP-type peptidyl-prolyl cis-trans isomerase [Oligoflexales bacterium]
MLIGIIGVSIAAVAIIVAVLMFKRSKPPEQGKSNTSFEKKGVDIVVLSPGKGAEAKNGKTVHVHYMGMLKNGGVFDSSRKRGRPISFKLGTGKVIKGWEIGIEGMRVGECRKLTIPPQLGYGAAGSPGSIPPGATLIFEVELVKVE